MVGIKDIAKHSGSSVSAVSRVINNSGYVSQEARQRIETAIAQLDYRPNAGARTLRSGKSHLIGVLLPSLEVEFFARIAHRIEQRLFAQGYQALICSTAEDTMHEAAYIQTLAAKQVDGLLVAAVGHDPQLFQSFARRKVPIVAIDRDLPDTEAITISVDHQAGGALAAAHLIALGHRDVVIFGAPEHASPVQLRAKGARQAFAKADLPLPDQIFGPKHSVAACEALARPILTRANRPSAVIATTDIAAIAVMRAARTLGLRVPEDLSVTGFDDMPAAAYVWPELTTIAQPMTDIADHAVAALLLAIKGEGSQPPPDVTLPVELVQRHSTAPPSKTS